MRAGRPIASILIAAALAGGATAHEPEAPMVSTSVAPEQRNAALAYAMLWAQTPDGFHELARSIPSPKAMAPDWSPPAAMRTKLDLHAALLDGVGQAAALERCDFELEREKGVSTPLPHMSFMHMTFRMLLADARRLSLEGEPDAAAARLTTMLGMARHLSMDLTHVSSRVAGEATQVACEHGAALLKSHDVSDEAKGELRAALDRFDPDDPFNARAATVATVEYSIANSALDLRDREFERIGNTGFIGIESIETPVPVTMPEQQAWIDTEMNRCRAWARDVIAAMGTTDNPDAELRAISQRARTGEYGPLAKSGLAYSLTPVWKAESEARASMQDLAQILGN